MFAVLIRRSECAKEKARDGAREGAREKGRKERRVCGGDGGRVSWEGCAMEACSCTCAWEDMAWVRVEHATVGFWIWTLSFRV